MSTLIINIKASEKCDCQKKIKYEFQQYAMCGKQRFRPACAYAQSDQSLRLSLEYYVTLRLLTENHLEFLSLKGGCTDSSESTLVKCHIIENHM